MQHVKGWTTGTVLLGACLGLAAAAETKYVYDSLVLTEDADWTAADEVVFNRGIVVDLNGHSLKLPAFAGSSIVPGGRANVATPAEAGKRAFGELGADMAFHAGTPANAFDGNVTKDGRLLMRNTSGGTTFDIGVGWKFDRKITLDTYALTTGVDFHERDPKSWTFEGRNEDTETWTVLSREKDVVWQDKAADRRAFTVATPRAFRQYRVHFTANQKADGYGSFLCIGEIELYESLSAAFSSSYIATAQTSHLEGCFFNTEAGTAFDGDATSAGRALVRSEAAANYRFDASFDVTLAEARKATRYTIVGAPTKERSPGAWMLQGRASDEEDWTTLDARAGVTWEPNETKSFTVGVPQACTQFRVRMTDAAGDSRWSGARYLEFNEISIFAGYPDQDAEVTNTADGDMPAMLEVAPAGVVTNSTVALSGNVKVVKTGTGSFTAARARQSYTGGTEVREGTLVVGAAPDQLVLGGRMEDGAGVVRVGPNGTLDLNNYGNWRFYQLRLDGGMLTGGSTNPNFVDLALTADSAAVFRANFAAVWNDVPAVDLGGHVFTVATEKFFNIGPRGAVNGTLKLTSGGWFNTTPETVTDLSTVSLEVEDMALNLGGELWVSNYVSRFARPQSNGVGPLKVFGTFTPAGPGFWAPTLQDGATLDLSAMSGVWSTTATEAADDETLGRTTVSFEPGATVTLDLGARTFAAGDQILSWTAAPDGVTFVVKGDETPTSQTAQGLFYGGDPDATEVASATWTGAAGDGDVRNPENWACLNPVGRPVVGGIPGAATTIQVKGTLASDAADLISLGPGAIAFGDVVLAKDCDWSGFDVAGIASGVTIDLQGHAFTVAGGDEMSPTAFTVTDSVGGGVFTLNVPAGATFVNTRIALEGGLKFVKAGPGCFRAQKTGHTYRGGTRVAEGQFALAIGYENDLTYSAGYGTLGFADTNDVDMRPGAVHCPFEVAEGAVFDMGGNYGLYHVDLVLAGGTLANYGYLQTQHAQYTSVGNVRLTQDSYIDVTNSCIAFKSGLFDLGGHTLTATVGQAANGDGGLIFYEPLSNGTLRVDAQAAPRLYYRSQVALDLATVTIDSDSQLQFRGDTTVGSLVCRTTRNAKDGDSKAQALVKDVFAPVTDNFPNVKLLDGATLDVTARTTPLVLTSAIAGYACSFADGATVSVAFGARNVKLGEPLVAWTAETKPSNLATLAFALDPVSKKRGYALVLKEDEGLFLEQRGLRIFVR